MSHVPSFFFIVSHFVCVCTFCFTQAYLRVICVSFVDADSRQFLNSFDSGKVGARGAPNIDK